MKFLDAFLVFRMILHDSENRIEKLASRIELSFVSGRKLEIESVAFKDK